MRYRFPVRAVAIVNGNARRLRGKVRTQLERALPGGVRFTGSLDEARSTIRAEVRRGVDLVILGGGDGTVVMGLTLLGEVSHVHVQDVDAIVVPDGLGGTVRHEQISNTRDATAVQFLVQAGYKQVLPGWDFTLSLVNGYDVDGKSAIGGALGSYTGKGDIRYAVGGAFKYLNNLELGLTYNGYAGGASLENRTLADRSYAAFSAKYSF